MYSLIKKEENLKMYTEQSKLVSVKILLKNSSIAQSVIINSYNQLLVIMDIYFVDHASFSI